MLLSLPYCAAEWAALCVAPDTSFWQPWVNEPRLRYHFIVSFRYGLVRAMQYLSKPQLWTSWRNPHAAVLTRGNPGWLLSQQWGKAICLSRTIWQASQDCVVISSATKPPEVIQHVYCVQTAVTICCSVPGVLMPAHRAVLAARCEVMAAMFNGNYAEANSCVVPIHSVSKDTFLSFLEYIYTDTCCPGRWNAVCWKPV